MEGRHASNVYYVGSSPAESVKCFRSTTVSVAAC